MRIVGSILSTFASKTIIIPIPKPQNADLKVLLHNNKLLIKFIICILWSPQVPMDCSWTSHGVYE